MVIVIKRNGTFYHVLRKLRIVIICGPAVHDARAEDLDAAAARAEPCGCSRRLERKVNLHVRASLAFHVC